MNPKDRRILEACLLFCVAAVSVFMKIISGFGKGITFQIGYFWLASFHLILRPHLRQSVLLIFIAFVPVAFLNMKWVLENIDQKFTGILWLGQLIGSLVGNFVLVSYSNIWVERSLGFILLFVLAFDIFRSISGFTQPREVRGLNAEEIFEHVPEPHFFLLALICGIFGGVYGTGGPPLMAFGLYYNIQKDLLTASTIFAICLGNGIISIVYLGYFHGEINHETLPIVLAVFGGCLVGFATGRIVNEISQQRDYKQLLRLVLFCGSIVIISHGFGHSSQTVARFCGLMLVMGAAVFVMVSICRVELEAFWLTVLDLLDIEPPLPTATEEGDEAITDTTYAYQRIPRKSRGKGRAKRANGRMRRGGKQIKQPEHTETIIEWTDSDSDSSEEEKRHSILSQNVTRVV